MHATGALGHADFRQERPLKAAKCSARSSQVTKVWLGKDPLTQRASHNTPKSYKAMSVDLACF